METSYNGWPASPDKNAIGIVPFGDTYGLPFPGGVKGGDVRTVLGYVAAQLHHRVEPCIAGWDWGYNYRANVNNPSVLSCHSSGTAIDYNAPNHPNGASGTFSSVQVGEIRRILAEVQGAVQWGGDYSGTPDEMHFEIIVNAADLAAVAATLPTTPTEGDWFDMATEEDLTRIMNEALAFVNSDDYRQDIANRVADTLTVGAKADAFWYGANSINVREDIANRTADKLDA